MSAILSADDLNDFISPGVACIKPIETIPKNQHDSYNPYEVTTEDKVAATNPTPAQISLTDCLACSGCVTSAEAVLVSLQSHNEVLNALDTHPSLSPPWLHNGYYDSLNKHTDVPKMLPPDGKIFVATVSPQARASLAATYNVTSVEAGNMINQLLRGTEGLAPTTPHHTTFLWVLDTNALRPIIQNLAYTELVSSPTPKKPLLTSVCPGWICYTEKTHPYALPHLSRLKSPQALAGTLLKSVLAAYGVPPERVWHLAVMPCFDKKLEAARTELTSSAWSRGVEGVRDVDCVITAREIVALAEARGIAFSGLPRTGLPRVRFPDRLVERVLFHARGTGNGEALAGTSGGFLWHVLRRFQSTCPGSRIRVERGRNADVVEYLLVRSKRVGDDQGPEEVVFKAARYYGFRNIQNLVRKLKPPRTSRLLAATGRGGGARKPGAATSVGKEAGLDYAYVEVMACPGGCTNGGGQIKVGDVVLMRGEQVEGKETAKIGPQEQREWLGQVDEAYFSASDEDEDEDCDEMEIEEHGNAMDSHEDVVDGISRRYIHDVLEHWKDITSVELDKLVYTSYREVESDVGKQKKSDVERVAGLASSIGGGW